MKGSWSMALLCLFVGLQSHQCGAQAASVGAGTHAAAGAELFKSSGCSHCHGDAAQGGEIGPSLLDAGKRLKPDAIRSQIHDGGKVMPAFAEILSDDQIADLVTYLRTLHPARRRSELGARP